MRVKFFVLLIQQTVQSVLYSLAEKDELLLRNAQLSQDVESLKRRHHDVQQDLNTELQQKNNSIAGLEQVLQEMTSELASTKQKVSVHL